MSQINRTDAIIDALRAIYELAAWHCDDDADEDNTSPDDQAAHVNGLIRREVRVALHLLGYMP